VPPLHFLIVDDIDDNRFLLSRALRRDFPDARIVECLESGAALAALAEHNPTAIIVHRSFDLNGPETIRRLRQAAPTTAIIMVSGRESCPEGLTAGANAFLNYQSWSRIGTVVTEVLSPEYVKPLTDTPFKPERDYLGHRPGRAEVSAP
jgi:CheY-like chemotaxis protein